MDLVTRTTADAPPPSYINSCRPLTRRRGTSAKAQERPLQQALRTSSLQQPSRLNAVMLFASAAVLLGVVAVARAAYSDEASVPHGQVIPGNYTGALRPQIHFTPPQAFMNDPNGMFRDPSGTWHLYYQCASARRFGSAEPISDRC